jgi:hypothetical protein
VITEFDSCEKVGISCENSPVSKLGAYIFCFLKFVREINLIETLENISIRIK